MYIVFLFLLFVPLSFSFGIVNSIIMALALAFINVDVPKTSNCVMMQEFNLETLYI